MASFDYDLYIKRSCKFEGTKLQDFRMNLNLETLMTLLHYAQTVFRFFV